MALLLWGWVQEEEGACGYRAWWFLLMWAKALSFHTTRFCVLVQENTGDHFQMHMHIQTLYLFNRRKLQAVRTSRPLTTRHPEVFGCWKRSILHLQMAAYKLRV